MALSPSCADRDASVAGQHISHGVISRTRQTESAHSRLTHRVSHHIGTTNDRRVSLGQPAARRSRDATKINPLLPVKRTQSPGGAIAKTDDDTARSAHAPTGQPDIAGVDRKNSAAGFEGVLKTAIDEGKTRHREICHTGRSGPLGIAEQGKIAADGRATGGYD